MSLSGLPIRFWFEGQWYIITAAEIANSKPLVQLNPENPALATRLGRNLVVHQGLGETYTIDRANKVQCFLSDVSAFESWQEEKERERDEQAENQ